MVLALNVGASSYDIPSKRLEAGWIHPAGGVRAHTGKAMNSTGTPTELWAAITIPLEREGADPHTPTLNPPSDDGCAYPIA